MLIDISKLQPGDVLLYKGTGVYGWIIRTKTWHNIGHVEVYIGAAQSVASRDGQGTAIYPIRTADLMYVLRPKGALFQRRAAMDWFYRHGNGQPYGWLDLLQFVGLNVNKRGVVCSPFATLFLRAGGIPIFNTEPAERVAPFEFLLSEDLTDITSEVIHV